MSDEFGVVAGWPADAVVALGPDHALPAACRGSGSPASLDWLGHHTGLSPGVRFVDVGAGVGGPAEYAARTTGATPLLVEPMEAACHAASRLFGRDTVVGNGESVLCGDASFHVAWSLGVLCTVRDKSAHLSELARLLAPDGALGLLVYERTVEKLPDQPDGNHFPTADEVMVLIRRAGLVVRETALVTDLPPAPRDWEEAAARVDTWMRSATRARVRGSVPRTNSPRSDRSSSRDWSSTA